MQPIERAVISHFIASALDAGFTVHSVHDGEERHTLAPTHSGTVREALEHIDAVDESRVYFGRPDGGKRETLCIILGNGADCLSDMSEGRAEWDALCGAEFKWSDQGADVILSEEVAERDAQIEALRTTLAHATQQALVLRTAATDAMARLSRLQTLAAEYRAGMNEQDRAPTGEDWDNLNWMVLAA